MKKVSVPVQQNPPSSTLVPTLSQEPICDSSQETFFSTPESQHSEDSFFLTVPPTTPAPEFTFCHPIETIQRPFPKLDSFQIPYIRQVGVKASLDILSNFFSCPNYKVNPVQFWLLDVIADCLWKLQDEFHFPERYQKIIIEWILFHLDLIRDPQKNLSRREFFQIFNEALTIANEKIQDGCEVVPSPNNLFSLVQRKDDEDEEISFDDTIKNSSLSSTSSGKSFVAVEIDDDVEVAQLPRIKEEYPKRIPMSTGQQIEETAEEEILCGCEESIEFYQPDPDTPERFRSSSSSLFSSDSDDSATPIDTTFKWVRSLPTKTVKEKSNFEKVEQDTTSGITVESHNDVKTEWKDYLKDRQEMIQNLEKNIMINSCVLTAIKDIVYDYLYESFQYRIVKLALMNTFHSVTQRVNTKWNIPKILKEELKKPKEKKEKKKKKEKVKKEKAPKKKTKTKKDKKKKKAKKDRKKGKKPKKPAKKKLTKEEKEELARQKREQERLEEEQRIAEENRLLLFPLKEATDDDFFKSIFDHWVKPKENEAKGKNKKRKKK